MGPAPSAWGTGAADVPPSLHRRVHSRRRRRRTSGTNLALGRPATSSASCNANESAAKAFDGGLANNSKWCSSAAGTKFLQVDLGCAAERLRRSCSSTPAWAGRTPAGTPARSRSLTSPSTAPPGPRRPPSTGARSSRTYHPVSARAARYVRLDINTPTNNGDTAARIYEFEVYGGAAGPTNVALGKPATGSARPAPPPRARRRPSTAASPVATPTSGARRPRPGSSRSTSAARCRSPGSG